MEVGDKIKLCDCGCGKYITYKESQKYKKPRRYIQYHHPKWNKGLIGKEYLIHYKNESIWNKGLPKELQPRFGKKVKEEVKRAIGEKHIGKKVSKETRIKQSEAQKKLWENKSHREHMIRVHSGKSSKKKGIPISKEQLNKLRKIWNSPEYKRKAKEKRMNMVIPVIDTSIEVKIQNFLKQLGIDFFTHQYIKEIEHGYQCDIFIPSMNLVIECDGDYWHCNPSKYKIPINKTQIEHIERDKIRTKELVEKGFKVLRLWESEIKVMDLNDFKDKLL